MEVVALHAKCGSAATAYSEEAASRSILLGRGHGRSYRSKWVEWQGGNQWQTAGTDGTTNSRSNREAESASPS